MNLLNVPRQVLLQLFTTLTQLTGPLHSLVHLYTDIVIFSLLGQPLSLPFH